MTGGLYDGPDEDDAAPVSIYDAAEDTAPHPPPLARRAHVPRFAGAVALARAEAALARLDERTRRWRWGAPAAVSRIAAAEAAALGATLGWRGGAAALVARDAGTDFVTDEAEAWTRWAAAALARPAAAADPVAALAASGWRAMDAAAVRDALADPAAPRDAEAAAETEAGAEAAAQAAAAGADACAALRGAAAFEAWTAQAGWPARARLTGAVVAMRAAACGVCRALPFAPLAAAGALTATRPLAAGPDETALRWAPAVERAALAHLLALDRLEAWRADLRLASGLAARVADALMTQPTADGAWLQARLGVTQQHMNRALTALRAAGLVAEATRRGRFRRWRAAAEF
ncbi:MAG: hypothetical protein GW902_00145 [Alphaproteobacteria bacterium]|nr:hypothetical protein [Alphaproteobacteria bacterium]